MRLWNARTLKLIAELKDGHQDWIYAAAFSSDGSLIASGGRDTRVCLWDGFTGAFKEKLPQRHKEAIVNIEFVLGDSAIVAIDTYHQILCWSVARTKWAVHRARAMQGIMHTGEVAEIASSPDRKLLATFSLDKSIKLWDPESATAVGQPMLGSDEVISGSFSIDAAKVIAGYLDGMLRIWDVATQTLLHSLSSDSRPVSHIAVSPDGRLVASGGGRLCLWNINSGELVFPPLEKYISCLAFNQTGRRLVFGSRDGCLTVLDLRSSEEGVSVDTMTLRGHTSSINDVASSPNGRLLASASQDGTLRAWDTDLVDMSIRTNSTDHSHQRVTSLAVSRDGTRLVSAGDMGDFQIWNFSTGQKVGQMFHSTEGEVNDLVFSSSNTLWASSHSIQSGGNVCIWEWQADHVTPTTYTLLCGQGHITCIEFTEDRKHVVTGGMDQSVRSWNLSSRSCVANFDCASVPQHIAVSHEGRYLACASDDANFRVWDLESHQLIGSPQPGYTERPYYSYTIQSITFSPYRASLVARRGQKIQLFDIQDDIRCCASFEPPSSVDTQSSWRPAFSPDGSYLFYGTYTFNLTTLSQDAGLPATKFEPDRSVGLPLSTVSPLFADEFLGRIHSNRWPEPLLVIPADVRISRWVAHGNMMAFGSSDGRVFIIRFPNESI
jgi:WD40 repeat protein